MHQPTECTNRPNICILPSFQCTVYISYWLYTLKKAFIMPEDDEDYSTCIALAICCLIITMVTLLIATHFCCVRLCRCRRFRKYERPIQKRRERPDPTYTGLQRTPDTQGETGFQRTPNTQGDTELKRVPNIRGDTMIQRPSNIQSDARFPTSSKRSNKIRQGRDIDNRFCQEQMDHYSAVV